MTTEVDSPSEEISDGRSDAELITAVRAGDSDAYAALYARHSHAATRLARTLARDRSEADDLVAEAFTRILATLQDGRGPDLAFRAYLHTTIRHTHYDRARAAARTQPVDEVPEPEPGPGADDPAIEGLNRSLATRAFQTLPERWQLVLWHTEIEGDTPAAIAPLLGLTPNGVAALAYRARERLRQAYLQAHLTDTPPAASCATVTPMLAADIRGNLATRDHTKVTTHLNDCATCTALYTELTDLNNNLAALLAPAVLGTTWAAYLGTATATKAGILAWLTAAPATAATGVRETITKLGPRNTAIAGGVAAAVAAAALAATLIASDQPTTPPQRPPAAQPPAPPPGGPPGAPPAPPPPPPANPPAAPPGGGAAPEAPPTTPAPPTSAPPTTAPPTTRPPTTPPVPPTGPPTLTPPPVHPPTPTRTPTRPPWFPGLPDLPDLPDLPGLPSLPGLPALPSPSNLPEPEDPTGWLSW